MADLTAREEDWWYEITLPWNWSDWGFLTPDTITRYAKNASRALDTSKFWFVLEGADEEDLYTGPIEFKTIIDFDDMLGNIRRIWYRAPVALDCYVED
jgi:hypothetical protein